MIATTIVFGLLTVVVYQIAEKGRREDYERKGATKK